MEIIRTFRISPALARLLHKLGNPGRIVEGHFATEPGRQSLVRIDGDQCDLVLVQQDSPDAVEEKVRVPAKQGAILLDVCAGRLELNRISFPVGGRHVSLDRILKPGPLDVAWIAFERQEEADNFDPPVWFGPEVSDTAAFGYHDIAIGGVPAGEEVELSNAALNSILDEIEGSIRNAEITRLRSRA